MMIAPMIHRMLRREDLLRLVDEIACTDPAEAYPAARALEAGKVDKLLDSPVALEAIRGRGGAPAALPLTLLWYVPVRAALCERGERDIDLADYTASLPLAFLTTRAHRRGARGEATLTTWRRSVHSLPRDSVAQGEHAAYCGALALWWAGVFPDFVGRRGMGVGMIRAYVDFAAGMLDVAARTLGAAAPRHAAIYGSASRRTGVLQEALHDAGRDYIGKHAHSASSRLERYLARLKPAHSDPQPPDAK